MSVRQAERVGYLELVTDFFTSLRGQGLLLSPADEALVRDWERAGIPVTVVCQGLEMAAEGWRSTRPRRPPPPRLSYYAGAVTEAWRAAREKRVGQRSEEPTT